MINISTFRNADHSGRAVYGMYCLRSLERWDRGFESHSSYGCLYCVRLFCICVVLCVASGPVTGWSLVQGVLLTVYRISFLPHCSHTWEHRAEFPQFINQGQSVGLLGRVISSSQGLYLYTNTENTYTNTKHPCPEWDSNTRTQLPSERRHASDRSASVTGVYRIRKLKKKGQGPTKGL
jgi:hypothetical protein